VPNRIIKSTAHNVGKQLQHLLSSLFALELLAPSTEIYLFSPWVSDVPLLNSAFGQFRALLPEAETTDVRLSVLLNALADRGARVHILTKSNQRYTELFLSRLDEGVVYRCRDELHEKGLVTNHFYFRGSMNFTYSGIHLNDEHCELTTDQGVVAQALLEARQRWESLS
jgi:phosphatidylserine/phosphatidylglycerophosphate/cardiolipin synthase-like enzyme